MNFHLYLNQRLSNSANADTRHVAQGNNKTLSSYPCKNSLASDNRIHAKHVLELLQDMKKCVMAFVCLIRRSVVAKIQKKTQESRIESAFR